MSDESNRLSLTDTEPDDAPVNPAVELETLDLKAPASWLSRTIRWLIRLVLLAFLLVAILLVVVYRSAQREPEFYKSALAITPQAASQGGDDFEKRLLDLQNAARTEQQWQALFTDVQINGWLTADFPNKFPDTLPYNVNDPRVGLVENGLLIAFRYDSPRIKGIVHAEVDVFCTDVTGQFAVRIKKVQAGLAPIPVSSLANRITEMMRRLSMGVRWTEIEGDPTALIDLPPDRLKLGDNQIEIESIQLLEKKLLLSGRSKTF